MNRLVPIAEKLAKQAGGLSFADPVHTVYNPLVYAWNPHRNFLEKWGTTPKEVVLVGMNPGPWGMAQTGVPFGEIEMVRDWLQVEGEIRPPNKVHPKRPVEGFACGRSEVSGARLWGWARDRFGSPAAFFRRFFVYNYCPLAFMETSGRNRTPDKLPSEEKKSLFKICDHALLETVKELDPSFVIGIGRFAEERSRSALEGTPVKVGRILHPSPASPLANRGWSEAAEKELASYGIVP